MNIGIVTVWFERGAAYVSKQYKNILDKENDVFIYARYGEEYAIGNLNWDGKEVTWGKRIDSPFTGMVIDKKDFRKWVVKNNIQLILFNEQQWFQPLLWCKEWGIKTVAYIDYYTEQTVPLFEVYDMLLCNTKRHYSAFDWHQNAKYLPWGTDVELFKPRTSNLKLVNNDYVTFFHSCGMNIYRKGTKLLLQAFNDAVKAKKLIIHTQKEITDKSLIPLIKKLKEEGRLKIITKTVPAPGLFYLGDVYVYPTELEGIGLTIVEALSSGLSTVVPDNGPMNEFVKNNENGVLIKIEKSYARFDGYYWPKCISNRRHLTTIFNDLASDKEKVIKQKNNARNFAEQNLNFNKNLLNLNTLIAETTFKPISENLKSKINAYDNFGIRKLNKYVLLSPKLFHFFRNIFFKRLER